MRRLLKCLVLTIISLATAQVVSAAVPASITVQGKLSDSTGVPLPAGPKSFNFKIFASQAGGGVPVWPSFFGEPQVLASDASGLWIALMGAISPLTETVFADTVRWLEVTVDGVTLPRVRLATGPYAHRVATVDGASGGTITSKVSIGSGHTNTGANAFVAGLTNTVSGESSTIPGGESNIAAGDFSAVSSGRFNEASGSHSSVAGGLGNYATDSFAFVGGGSANAALAKRAAIGGGHQNRGEGMLSTIGGGDQNLADGPRSTIGGGHENRSTGTFSTIGGGEYNKVWAWYGTIGGGHSNEVDDDVGAGLSGRYATIGGGSSNRTTGDYGVIGGGRDNFLSGMFATLGGGDSNLVFGFPADSGSTIAGGFSNTASWEGATVGGGWNNYAESYGSVAGGEGNRADNYCAVGGGFSNETFGSCSTIPGGKHNLAGGDYSLAAGRFADASHDQSFVWNSEEDTVESTRDNQFLISASGGVRVSEPAGGAFDNEIGDVFQDNLIVAWGSIDDDGSILADFGVSSISHTITGAYRINLNATAASSSNLAVSAILEVDVIPNSAATARLIYANMIGGDGDTFDIFITNGSHVAVDNQFTFIVTAR